MPDALSRFLFIFYSLKEVVMAYKVRWIAICTILAVSLYVCITTATTLWHNWLVVVMVAWFASPILFLIFALIFERESVEAGGRGATVGQVFASVFNPRKQAWSFLVGDLIILPAAFAVAALRWSMSDYRMDLSLLWWWIASFAIGVVAGCGFHYGIDRPEFTKKGMAASLNSPTKLLHDFVSYPVLIGGLFFVVGPILLDTNGYDFAHAWHLYVILGLVAVWFVLGVVVDARRAKALAPWGHPGFDLKEEMCISY